MWFFRITTSSFCVRRLSVCIGFQSVQTKIAQQKFETDSFYVFFPESPETQFLWEDCLLSVFSGCSEDFFPTHIRSASSHPCGSCVCARLGSALLSAALRLALVFSRLGSALLGAALCSASLVSRLDGFRLCSGRLGSRVGAPLSAWRLLARLVSRLRSARLSTLFSTLLSLWCGVCSGVVCCVVFHCVVLCCVMFCSVVQCSVLLWCAVKVGAWKLQHCLGNINISPFKANIF